MTQKSKKLLRGAPSDRQIPFTRLLWPALLALPALLFDVTAHAHWSAIWKPGFIGAFGLALAFSCDAFAASARALGDAS